jgi:hypothetical protein
MHFWYQRNFCALQLSIFFAPPREKCTFSTAIGSFGNIHNGPGLGLQAYLNQQVK